jgi:hypothetical protein
VRLSGAPYTRDEGTLRNAFELHLVNKSSEKVSFAIEPELVTNLSFIVPIHEVRIEPLSDRRLPVFVTMDHDRFTTDRPFEIVIRATGRGNSAEQRARAVFLGAK